MHIRAELPLLQLVHSVNPMPQTDKSLSFRERFRNELKNLDPVQDTFSAFLARVQAQEQCLPPDEWELAFLRSLYFDALAAERAKMRKI